MENLMSKVHNRKGFTLIELIIVIVIIAILAAIVIPAVSRYVGDAKDSRESGNLAVVKSAAGAAAATATKDGGVNDQVFKDELKETLETTVYEDGGNHKFKVKLSGVIYYIRVYDSGRATVS